MTIVDLLHLHLAETTIERDSAREQVAALTAKVAELAAELSEKPDPPD